MKIIFGLGNPGKSYENTRHNVGFRVLDHLKETWGFSDFILNKKFNAEISEGVLGKEKIILAKPQTFMNLSGISVRAMLDFYKLFPGDLIVIQDELDLPLGKHKIARDSSAAGHNGIKNIIEQLGTQSFIRLRIGITTPSQKESCMRDTHDFVLQKFTQDETALINEQLPSFLDILEKTVASS